MAKHHFIMYYSVTHKIFLPQEGLRKSGLPFPGGLINVRPHALIEEIPQWNKT